MNKFYVSMTDKFMSGWGPAEGKLNKLVIECDTLEEAMVVRDNALGREEMYNVTILREMPYYPPSEYYVSLHDKSDYGSWFIEGKWRR